MLDALKWGFSIGAVSTMVLGFTMLKWLVRRHLRAAGVLTEEAGD